MPPVTIAAVTRTRVAFRFDANLEQCPAAAVARIENQVEPYPRRHRRTSDVPCLAGRPSLYRTKEDPQRRPPFGSYHRLLPGHERIPTGKLASVTRFASPAPARNSLHWIRRAPLPDRPAGRLVLLAPAHPFLRRVVCFFGFFLLWFLFPFRNSVLDLNGSLLASDGKC